MSAPGTTASRVAGFSPRGSACAGRRPKPTALAVTLVTLALGAAQVAAQGDGALPPAPWPAELGRAFELYYAGEFLEVQRVCRELSAGTRDVRLRREAAALATMATLRLPSRDSRIGARARLAQLAEEDASLLSRPECQLAYGIAQTALSETATALHHLNQAAQTFANRGQDDRLAETCVALAEAWARHGEWELALPGVDLPRPTSRAAADRIRRDRIRAARQRVETLPGSAPYLARIDLALARHLVESADGVAEGRALLEELAGRKELTPAVAEASLVLGERYEAERRWTDAARLYARLQAGALGELSRQAEERRNTIERPQLILDLPAQAAPGERITVGLRARNVATAEFEVRRVNLADWLSQRQGRFAEAALPSSGALVAVRDLSTAVSTAHDWWSSASLDEPLTFAAPAGEAVVLARAVDDEGQTVTAKRLLTAGNMQVSVFFGSRHAVIWALAQRQPGTDASTNGLKARFWMHGSFVPTRPEFVDDVAIFALPPEARLLRDKRWTCLVQSGEEVALCHGVLPVAGGEQRPKPAVALIGGPPEPRVGEELQVFGLLLGGLDGQAGPRWPPTIQLELLDYLDSVLSTTTVDVSDAGTFATRFPISVAMAGEHLRVAARLDGRVLESVQLRPSLRVAALDEARFSVRGHLPGWLRPGSASVLGQVSAAYPWGTPLAGVSASTRFRAVRLPTTEPRREAVHSYVVSDTLRLDAEGRWDFVQPLADFALPDGPLAIGLWVEAAGWDGRRRQGLAEVLVSPEPVHLWLGRETETLRVGEPLHVFVGWFDPTGCAAGARPTVTVWREGALVIELGLLPAINGWRSQLWRPTSPGRYELVASLPLNEGNPVTAREELDVEPGTQPDPPDATGGLSTSARLTQHAGQPHVRVQLDGTWRHPLLVLVEAGDPLAARSLPALDRPVELLLPLTGRRRNAIRLVLAAPGRDGVQVLGATEVRPAADEALTLTLSAQSNEPAPGATVQIGVTSLRAGQPSPGTTLLARLIDAADSGGVQWLPGEVRSDLALLPGGIEIASSTKTSTAAAAPDAGPRVIPETRELPAALARALFDGRTLWLDSRLSGDDGPTFTVPLPAKPGLYRVLLAACAPDGAVATETLDLDTRRGLQLVADVPEQLTVGDRSAASLVVASNGPRAQRARVSFDGGRGLHADELRLLTRPAAPERHEDGTSLTLTLAPFGTATLHASVEATRPGGGAAAFIVETERGPQRATAPYYVHADVHAPAEAAPQTVVLRRELFLLKEHVVAEDSTLGPEEQLDKGQREWLRLEVKPDERLAPGRLVLVREQFSLEQPLERVEWEQRLPANCCTHASEWSELRRIGAQGDLRLGALTHRATRLEAGDHIHEYVIVPVRPGACRFPPPTVRAAGRAVATDVAEGPRRVLVAGSR